MQYARGCSTTPSCALKYLGVHCYSYQFARLWRLAGSAHLLRHFPGWGTAPFAELIARLGAAVNALGAPASDYAVFVIRPKANIAGRRNRGANRWCRTPSRYAVLENDRYDGSAS